MELIMEWTPEMNNKLLDLKAVNSSVENMTLVLNYIFDKNLTRGDVMKQLKELEQPEIDNDIEDMLRLLRRILTKRSVQ